MAGHPRPPSGSYLEEVRQVVHCVPGDKGIERALLPGNQRQRWCTTLYQLEVQFRAKKTTSYLTMGSRDSVGEGAPDADGEGDRVGGREHEEDRAGDQ